MALYLIIFVAVVFLFIIGMFLAIRFIYNGFQKNNTNMTKSNSSFTQTFTFKGIIISLMILVLLIPGAMIQDLIKERQNRSRETVLKINEKWSRSQTLCAPLLIVPYTKTLIDNDNKVYKEEHTLYITPKNLDIKASLSPVEKHYGIYKTILYKSDIHFEGNFSDLQTIKIENSKMHYDKASLYIGVTDLRGVMEIPDFKINNKSFESTIGIDKLFSVEEDFVEASVDRFGSSTSYVSKESIYGQTLIVNLEDFDLPYNLSQELKFDCNIKLKGSSSINFIPVGQNTSVSLVGEWSTPSFIGKFSPESSIGDHFEASWNILSFNRKIPQYWSYGNFNDLGDNSFGVDLIEPVDHYQQNMRSAKYSLMFIALTFIAFFFVEIFTKKPIKYFQYLLVGIALILFYSLLLSLSEQLGFSWAYLIASVVTICLTTTYFYSLVKAKSATVILSLIMIALYSFLYIILQMEDLALLFGSIFLFIVLGIIMFVSNKIHKVRE